MPTTHNYPRDFALNTVLPIRDQSALHGNLRSDIIYKIDGSIIMQGSINIPDNGLFIEGSDANLDSLDCAGAFPLFVGGGNLFIRNCKLSASQTGASVFNITAADPFYGCEMTNVNFENCKALGTITDYRQGLWFNVALFGCDDGLTLAGTWGGGFRIETTIIRTFDVQNNGGIVLKGATGATFGSRIVSNANIQVNGTSTAYMFTEEMFNNDQSFQLVGGELSGTGTYVDGIDVTSTKCRWASVGIPQTAPGGKMTLTTPATTSISAANTPEKLNGTTVLSDAIWVDDDGGQNNRVKWLNDFSGNVRVYGVISLTSTNNRQIGVILKVFNDIGVEQESFAFPAITTNGNGRAENITIAQFFTLNKNWYIEIWAENQSNNSNITLEINSVLLLEQRKAV